MLICQLTDLHMCPPGSLAAGGLDTNAMADRAFAAVAGLDPPPDAILVTGDLADRGSAAEYTLFLASMRRHVQAPIYVIPGNHDRRDTMRQVLGGLPGLGGPDAGEFVQYVVDDLPLRLVMLDTLVPGEAHGELCAARLDFLERSLAAAPQRPTLVAMHHPPFACGIGFMDRIGLRRPDEFAAVIARHRQVRRVLCGHVHRAVLGQVAHAPAWIGPSVGHQLALSLRADASGAFVLEPPAFTLHRWTEAEGIASHIAYVGPSPGPFPLASA